MVLGVLKRNEKRSKVRRDTISTLLKLICIYSLFLFVSTNNTIILGEGFFILDKVNSSLLEEGERGRILCTQNGFLFLIVVNSSHTEEFTDYIQIVDFQQPENPVVVGRFDLDVNEILVDFKISENTAYLLRRKRYEGVGNWTISLLDISELTNPILLGTTPLENITSYSLNPNYLSIHDNYAYVNTDLELVIFNCSDPSLPVKVANYTSFGGELHVNNDFLYIVSNGVKIYSLADPVNPLFLGEVNSTLHSPASSGVFGNYIIQAFQWSGLQAYNLTDPYHPTICGNYAFPQREIQPGGQIRDMEIVGDKLFAGGRKLYVFDLSNPQNLERITRKNIGSRDINRITASDNYLFVTIQSNIIIYSYIENSLGRNLGLGLGIGLPVVVVASLLILRKKKKG